MTAKVRHSEVLVVGAGPAGMAAATAAANCGRQVVVLDDNLCAGGQIWRNDVSEAQRRSSATRKARGEDSVRRRVRVAFERSGAELLEGRRVVDAPAAQIVSTLRDGSAGCEQENFRWDRLIVATGARERFLPFPGWALPGVFGAGGLQALVKGGFPIEGRRVVVAGTGPLLLAVAAYLRKRGARVLSIAEQASLTQIVPFAAGLWSSPGKLLQAARYRAMLAGVPYRTGWWPAAVERSGEELLVKLTDGARELVERCDALACGFHLAPNTELAALLNCRFDGDAVDVNRLQETSVANVFCAGEPTGIAGLDAALTQGEIAGLAAGGDVAKASALNKRRAKEEHFGRRMNAAFELRPEMRSLCRSDTIVCRCEDVTYGRLEGHASWTEAKLQTRCGMGPCQGRICGPAAQTLFGWQAASVRPPIFPVPIGMISGTEDDCVMEETTLEEAR